jgi:hypothetical protein
MSKTRRTANDKKGKMNSEKQAEEGQRPKNKEQRMIA